MNQWMGLKQLEAAAGTRCASPRWVSKLPEPSSRSQCGRKLPKRLPLLRPPPRPGPCPCFLHKLLLGMTAHLRRTILEDARTREWPDRSNSIQPRVLHSTQSSGQPAVECSGWLLGSSLTCCPIQLHRPSLAASVQICRSSPARQAASGNQLGVGVVLCALCFLLLLTLPGGRAEDEIMLAGRC